MLNFFCDARKEHEDRHNECWKSLNDYFNESFTTSLGEKFTLLGVELSLGSLDKEREENFFCLTLINRNAKVFGGVARFTDA